MQNNVISIGLDLSLVGTGAVILENGKILAQRLIKSKPTGDKPVEELKRIQGIIGNINSFIEENSPDQPSVAVIEGLAYMVKNATALTQLSALNYMTRAMLLEREIPFVIVAPTSLKKFITGSGAAKKDVMLMETFKRYGVTILDDNENDAYGLAQVGLALKGGNSKAVTKLQEEVLSLLRKQI